MNAVEKRVGKKVGAGVTIRRFREPLWKEGAAEDDLGKAKTGRDLSQRRHL